eukprot:2517935-Lingulodinium_polyedra.AAC.1
MPGGCASSAPTPQPLRKPCKFWLAASSDAVGSSGAVGHRGLLGGGEQRWRAVGRRGRGLSSQNG